MNLLDIREPIVQLCEAISKVAEVGIVVADASLKKIANIYKDDPEAEKMKVSFSSIIANVIREGEPLILNRIQDHPGCSTCRERFSCRVSGFIGVPIKYDGVVIGAIALITPVARSINLFGNMRNAVDFLSITADLICRILVEHYGGEDDKKKLEYDSFWESLPELAVARVNEKGRIVESAGTLTSFFSNAMTVSSINELLSLPNSFDLHTQNRFFYSSPDRLGFYGIVTVIPGEEDNPNALTTVLFQDKRSFLAAKESSENDTGRIIFQRYPPFVNLVERGRQQLMKRRPVLLQSGHGRGEVQIAEAIHKLTLPEGSPFLAVNCESIPLLEQVQTVFGSENGLTENGLLWKANRGTVFFSNIEFMSFELQQMLLPLMENKSTQCSGVYGAFHLHFIFSTDKNLQDLKQSFYLNERLEQILEGCAISVPELDPNHPAFPALFEEIVNSLAFQKQHGSIRLDGQLLDCIRGRECLTLLDLYRISEIVANSIKIQTISLSDVPALQSVNALGPGGTYKNETARIQELLRQGMDKNRIAQELGISRATLYRRLKQLENE